MRIHLPALSRRQFLAGSLATGVALWSPRAAAARPVARGPTALETPVDPHRLSLLSDTHVDAKLCQRARGTNMADHLRTVCDQILALGTRPAAVLINGDLAHRRGTAGDYAAAVSLLEPLRLAGVPIHVAMGNHDSRQRFRAALPAAAAAAPPPEGASSLPPVSERHVSLIELPHANLLVLDSLDVTSATRGSIGAGQLEWLAATLDARGDKPALVFVHHHPELGFTLRPSGISDTPALLDVLAGRRQAKALFFGHTHAWSVRRRVDGLYLVNLPATAYVFNRRQPSGWVDAHLAAGGATLHLRCVNPSHPLHGENVRLAWRI